jgi:Asp-tRNA(Asn)/Glu-tRNA(Gln) amidotransferase B subunit
LKGKTGKTVSIRKKESQYDYRFMPEPNLLPFLIYPLKSFTPFKQRDENKLVCTRNPELIIENDYLDHVKNIATVNCFIDLDKAREELESKSLPQARRQHLIDNYQLTPENAFTFVAHNLDHMLNEIVDQFKVPIEDIKLYKRALQIDFLHVVNLNINLDKMSLNLKCRKIVSFVNDVLKAKLVSKRVSMKLFVDLFNQDENLEKLASDLIKEKNLAIINDRNVISERVAKLFSENSKAVNEYKSKEKKREKIFEFFVNRAHRSFNELACTDLVDEIVSAELKNLLK